MTLVSSKPKQGLMDRLSFKLAALLIFTFLGVFLVLAAYGVFVLAVEERLTVAALPTRSVVQDIDPKIAENLSKVVDNEDAEVQRATRDPFLDRGGISQLVAAPLISGPQPTQSTLSRTTNSVSGKVRPGRSAAGGQSPAVAGSGGTTSSNAGITVTKPVQLTTKDRLEMWEERAQYGDRRPPSSTIFAISDLIPVAVVDGGSGEKEVIFYSESADRTLSFPIGTRFYDGWLVNVLDEGVLFSNEDKVRPVTIIKSWGRGIRTRNSQTVSQQTKYDPGETDKADRKTVEKDSTAVGAND
ncbi:MAG: hypothetical protein HKN25_15650 [Pyrinomonadaceae bacterium]|nr:hypothetical protein [Pyrinomonadaceae bacterium]